MSTEAEATTINSQPEQPAPPKAQPLKKEKKKGKNAYHLNTSSSQCP